MPIYEYICNNCFSKFELLRPFSKADTEIICKSCSSNNVRRLLSTCFKANKQRESTTSATKCGSCNGSSCQSCHH